MLPVSVKLEQDKKQLNLHNMIERIIVTSHVSTNTKRTKRVLRILYINHKVFVSTNTEKADN